MKRKKLFLILLVVLLLGTNMSSAQFDQLEITAPESATVGEEITITVTSDGDLIEDATVSVDAIPIGDTDSNGQLKYTFGIIGIYLITASKWGYLPSDISTITIEQPLLTISVSPVAPNAGDEVTITVKANLIDPVNGATVSVDGASIGSTDSSGQIKHTFDEGGVYSIGAEKSGYTDAVPYLLTVIDLPSLLVIISDPLAPNAGDEVTFTVTANLVAVNGATVSVDGASIGSTDSSGQIKHTFDEGGVYSIGAEKSGYTDAVPYLLTVIDIDILEDITIQGAIFPVPDLLGNEILNYEDLPFQLPYTSLVATEDKLFIVFSDEKIEGGLANVEGWKLLSITWEGLEIGIVQAVDTSVDKEGIQVTIDEIKSNPEDYALKLVQMDITIRQCPFLLDIASLNIPITVGRVVKDPATVTDLSNLIEKTYEFDENLGRERLEQIINLAGEGLSIFDFGTAEYWIDSEATVNAIVLYPGVVEEFVSAMAGNEIKDLVIPSGETVLLYNVNTELKSIETSIEEINSDTEKYTDKVVTFEGSDIGISVSIKHTLSALIVGELLPIDLLLHGNVIWSRPTPSTLDELSLKTLLSIGVSSNHQDVAVAPVNGALEVFRYTGKIVSAEQIDESLSGSVLLLYKREKVDDISTEEIISEVKERIQDTILTIKYIFQRQSPEVFNVPVILSEEPGIIEIKKENIENITINLKNKAENISILVLKFENKPPEVTVNVSGEVYVYLEISIKNVPDDDVENAIIEFKVSKSWIIEADIDENSVKLYRYAEGNWDVLSTNIVRETSTEIYYSAESPGFSIFAITGEKEEGATGGTPGFEMVFAIAALLSVAYYLRKRK